MKDNGVDAVVDFPSNMSAPYLFVCTMLDNSNMSYVIRSTSAEVVLLSVTKLTRKSNINSVI
jgi:hypothetical protein